MSKIPVYSAIRIIPRESDYLDRKSGLRGEIFYDQDNNTLRLYDGNTVGGQSLFKTASDGSIDITAQKNKIRFHWDTLAELQNEVSPTTYHGMIAHVHAEGRLYFAHAGAWVPVANLSEAAGSGAGGGSGSITVAADDSTQVVIDAGEVLQIVGGTGISTASDSEGVITISSDGSGGFERVSVTGQSDIVAGPSNSLTVSAGSGIILSTDASTDTLTISAASGATTNSFAHIAVTGQNTVVADSATDTLTLQAGTGIALTTNDGTDTITIENSQPGVSDFSSLDDASNASLTVNKMYLPAITMLEVTNSGAVAYRFDQYGTTNNPTVYAINRTTIAFNLNNVSGHPFLIQTAAGVNYNTGLIHVSSDGTVSEGASAQGKTNGTLYWKIPETISGGYRYQCSVHAAMVGSILIKDFAAI